MKRNTIFLICSVIICTLSPAYAEDDREASYARCIDQRINQCQIKAERSSSRSACMKASAGTAARQVRFYQAHREELIRQMLSRGIDPRPAKINYFLIKAYKWHDQQSRAIHGEGD